MQFARIFLSRALTQSFATQNPAPSRREPFISSLRQKNTTKEIFLVVFVFSPLKMHSRERFLYLILNKSGIYEAILFGKVACIETVPDATLLIEVSGCNAEKLAAYVVVRT